MGSFGWLFTPKRGPAKWTAEHQGLGYWEGHQRLMWPQVLGVFPSEHCFPNVRLQGESPGAGGWVGGVSSEYGCSHWDGHTDRFCCSPPCAFSAGRGDPANDSPSCASPEEKSLASSPSAGWFPSSAQRRGWLLLGNPATHPWSLGPCRACLEPHDLGPPADWLSTLLTVTYFRTCFLDRFAVSTATRSSAF